MRRPGCSATELGGSKWVTSASAIRIGAARATGASCIATLLAQSPCSGLAGLSRPIGGTRQPRPDGELTGGDRPVAGIGDRSDDLGAEAHGASSLARRRSPAGIRARRCR